MLDAEAEFGELGRHIGILGFSFGLHLGFVVGNVGVDVGALAERIGVAESDAPVLSLGFLVRSFRYAIGGNASV